MGLGCMQAKQDLMERAFGICRSVGSRIVQHVPGLRASLGFFNAASRVLFATGGRCRGLLEVFL